MNNEIYIAHNDLIVSKTDIHGNIIFANNTFCKYAGYSINELVGQPHNIVRHPDMPKWAFADLWATVKRKEIWEGYVKNKSKNGDFYWVFATVIPVEQNGKPIEYLSVRTSVNADKKKFFNEFYKTHFKGLSA